MQFGALWGSRRYTDKIGPQVVTEKPKALPYAAADCARTEEGEHARAQVCVRELCNSLWALEPRPDHCLLIACSVEPAVI